jgi:O-methyltransferase
MRKFIRYFLNKFGYDIIKRESGMPSREVLFSNFSNLSLVHERLIWQVEGIKLPQNTLRTTLLARLRGTPPAEAFFIIKALFQTQNVGGDVCEFGVAQGETSALVANEILAGEKKLHLFDSFQGLSDPSAEDELLNDIFSLGQMPAYKGTMSYQKKWVISRLDAINFPSARYTIHEGFVEDVLKAEINLPEAIAFAYVDFDLYAPIKSTLEFLHTRTGRGAIIIIDDYDFFSSGVKKAVDEFVRTHSQYQFQIPEDAYGHFAILCRTV